MFPESSRDPLCRDRSWSIPEAPYGVSFERKLAKLVQSFAGCDHGFSAEDGSLLLGVYDRSYHVFVMPASSGENDAGSNGGPSAGAAGSSFSSSLRRSWSLCGLFCVGRLPAHWSLASAGKGLPARVDEREPSMILRHVFEIGVDRRVPCLVGPQVSRVLWARRVSAHVDQSRGRRSAGMPRRDDPTAWSPTMRMPVGLMALMGSSYPGLSGRALGASLVLSVRRGGRR